MESFYFNDYLGAASHQFQLEPPGQFDDLLAQVAAESFPLHDEKHADHHYLQLPVSALSPFDSSSASSSTTSSAPSPEPNDGSDSEQDSDSDVEPICLDNSKLEDSAFHARYLPTGTTEDAPFVPTAYRSPVDRGPKTARARKTLRSPRTVPAFPQTVGHPPPIIAVGSFSVRQNASLSSIFSAPESDRDADGESDGNATDDEYIPSPQLNPRKRRRSLSPSRTSNDTFSSSHASSSALNDQGRVKKRARLPPPSRNRQAVSPALLNRVDREPASEFNFTCPECGWKQTNERMPDFKRHLRTHTRPSKENQEKGWWCKGVLVKNAAQHHIPQDAEFYLFLGQRRTGGCMRTFSRRDALKRHLDNGNVTCIGRPCEAMED